MTNINAILNAILTTSIICKKKNSEGKYEQYTTTMLDDNFKHSPKLSSLEGEAKKAVSALESIFDYMESAATARNNNQRNKSVTKAHDFAKAYLHAVGMDDGIGNISMLTSVFAPKKQTVKGTVRGGYTTKSTFIKYALFMTYNFAQTGSWCMPKRQSKDVVANNIATPEAMAKYLAENFGMDYTTQLEALRKAEAERKKVA